MARKRGPFTCDEVDPDLKKLGVCYDFNPSYDVLALRPLFAAVAAVSLEPVEDLTPLSTMRAEMVEAGEVEGILLAAGFPSLRGADPELLLDLPLGASAVPLERDLYLARVATCEALKDDPDAYEAARCKRRAHVMIPGGRERFYKTGPYPKQDATTRKRLDDDLPFFDARTQSARLREKMRGAPTPVPVMTAAIEAGLNRWLVESGLEGSTYVNIPSSIGPLVAAGVPEAAARLLVRKQRGKNIPVEAEKPPITALITSLLGGAVLRSDEKGAWFDLSDPTFKLSKLRGEGKALKPLLEEAKWGKGWEKKTEWKKEKGKPAYPKVLISSAQIGRTPVKLLSKLGEALKKLSAKKSPQTLILKLRVPGTGGMTADFELQHSVLARREGASIRPDYTTLQGLTLRELPYVLSRKVLSPRKKRKGRQTTPLKTNPSRKPMARRKKTRRNPAPLYLSNEPLLNKDSFYYYPGTSWQYDEAGDFGHGSSVPTNRRNPAPPKRRKAAAAKKRRTTRAKGNPQAKKAMKLYHSGQAGSLQDAWDIVKSNPRRLTKRGTVTTQRVLWPRRTQYSPVNGQYGHSMSIPVNRRNPKSYPHETQWIVTLQDGSTSVEWAATHEIAEAVAHAQYGDDLASVKRAPSRNKAKKRRTTKARGNPQATEAMRLYHSGEAHSLQDAWDIVKSNPKRRRAAPKRRRAATKRRRAATKRRR